MVSEKAYSVEARLNALVAASVTSYSAVKPGDTARSSQTKTADPDLQLALPAGTFLIAAVISYRGGTGVSEGDLGWIFNCSTTAPNTSAFGYYGVKFTDTSGAQGSNTERLWTAGSAAQTTGTGNRLMLMAVGTLILPAADTFFFSWSKASAADGTTNTTVHTGSSLDAVQVG